MKFSERARHADVVAKEDKRREYGGQEQNQDGEFESVDRIVPPDFHQAPIGSRLKRLDVRNEKLAAGCECGVVLPLAPAPLGAHQGNPLKGELRQAGATLRGRCRLDNNV
ncbi:hypothetical protein [Neomesorhizobium albiziae]|uniref:hypothetical protein n=1 Tax=Neomesorhizobium albiziae TaxID=335020 RepID=UPI00122C34B1|nr:hypothetical protein [Mesorhizobium albiziae]